MLSFKGLVSNHWNGPGGIRELLGVSLPVIIAQASSSLMMFTDRYLLTALGKVYPASSMAGAFFTLCSTLFFIGLLTYVTPLVAQYLGAKQRHRCIEVLAQGILFSICITPIVHILASYLAPIYFNWSKIPIEESKLAKEYIEVLLWGNIFVFINVVFSGYFSGLGRSYVVMTTNLISLLINVPLTYYLIHQTDIPFINGVKGAATGTVISSAFGTLCFLSFLLKESNLRLLFSNIKRINLAILGKLLKFGSPTGLEFFLAFFAFNLAVMLFHSYGANEGLAVTIALNWDLLAFLPLWGLNIGLMSLTGRYLGAKKIELAQRTTFSGTKISYAIAIIYSLSFIFFRRSMVTMFLPEDLSSEDLNYLLPLTEAMLGWVAFYVFANATALVFSAPLRASGDTKWCMWTTIIVDWMCCILVFISVRLWHLEPINTWIIFVGSICIYSILITKRFIDGRWKSLSVI